MTNSNPHPCQAIPKTSYVIVIGFNHQLSAQATWIDNYVEAFKKFDPKDPDCGFQEQMSKLKFNMNAAIEEVQVD